MHTQSKLEGRTKPVNFTLQNIRTIGGIDKCYRGKCALLNMVCLERAELFYPICFPLGGNPLPRKVSGNRLLWS
jgi:hypothetical protein